MSRRESRSASVSTVAARKVRSYARMRRREDGFDMSGPEKPWGEYSPYKGGSYYFNAYQDRRASRVLQKYPQKTSQEEGDDEPYKSSRMRRTTLADDIKQTVQRDSDHLLLTVARLLIDESCVRAEPSVAANSQHNSASGKRPKKKILITQNSTSRPASAWKGRGTRKSVSSLSLNGSISSISATPSHSTLQDTSLQKKSSRSATPAGPTGHRSVRLADRSSSPVRQSATPRPLTARSSNRRSSVRRSSTPVSQPTPSQPSFTYAPPAPVSTSTPSPLPSNPLHSTSIQTRNDVQDAGTNTDAETRSISTQTAVDSDTQTELSYLMNRRPPLLPLSESTIPERVASTTPSVGAQSSAAREDDTTIPAHQGSLDDSTKMKKDNLQGQAEEQQEEAKGQQEEVTEQQEEVAEQQEDVVEQQDVAEQQEEIAEQQEEIAEQQEETEDIKEPIDKFKAAEERVKRAEKKVMEAEKELRKAEDELKEADEALQEADDEINATTADKETTEMEAVEEIEMQRSVEKETEDTKVEVTEEDANEEETRGDTREEATEGIMREEAGGIAKEKIGEEETERNTKEETGDNKREEETAAEIVGEGDNEQGEVTGENKAEAVENEADTREEQSKATADMREEATKTEEVVAEERNEEMEAKKESVVRNESEENVKVATDNHTEDSDSASRSNSQAAEDFSYSALPPTPPPRDPELYTDQMAQAIIKASIPNKDKDNFWDSD